MLALEISIQSVREKLFSEDNLLCAAIHKENKENGGELRPGHFIFAAFDHGKTDTGDTCSVSKFRLGQIEHFAQCD